jgi:ElaB/YqjD/DUF883 family membrane-anchored ribosome-binding protein
MGSEPVERLAAESEEARARIASTIDDIQDRLDPKRMVNDAVDRFTGNSLQVLGVARDAVRAHPVAIGAAAAAIGLALLARNRLAKATVNLGDNLGDYTDYDDGFGFAEVPTSRSDGGYDDEEPTVRTPRAMAARASERAGDTVDSNPIVSIILGLAAGAALGALFPATEAERRVLGDAGGKLGAAARAAGRRAADELDSAGLSVGKVRERAGRAARSVAAAARDELKG